MNHYSAAVLQPLPKPYEGDECDDDDCNFHPVTFLSTFYTHGSIIGLQHEVEKFCLQPKERFASIKVMTDEDVQSLLREHRYVAAFELLVERYQAKVFRLVYSLLKEAARAEEVTQDIFLKLWQVLPDYDGRASLSTWLYTIARNTSLTALRAESYRRTLPIDDYNPPAVSGETVWQKGRDRATAPAAVRRATIGDYTLLSAGT